MAKTSSFDADMIKQCDIIILTRVAEMIQSTEFMKNLQPLIMNSERITHSEEWLETFYKQCNNMIECSQYSVLLDQDG